MNKLFAVFDNKAASYGRIAEAPTAGLAARTFSDACLDKAGPLWQHASDYALFEIGTYDPTSGKVTPLPEPVHIISASTVKAQMILPISDPAAPELTAATTEIIDDLKKTLDGQEKVKA